MPRPHKPILQLFSEAKPREFNAIFECQVNSRRFLDIAKLTVPQRSIVEEPAIGDMEGNVAVSKVQWDYVQLFSLGPHHNGQTLSVCFDGRYYSCLIATEDGIVLVENVLMVDGVAKTLESFASNCMSNCMSNFSTLESDKATSDCDVDLQSALKSGFPISDCLREPPSSSCRMHSHQELQKRNLQSVDASGTALLREHT